MFLVRGWIKQPHTDDKNTSYEVGVFINARSIWRGIVGGHNRAAGIAMLLRRIARAIEAMSPEEKNSLEESLKLEYSNSLKANQVKCPACDRHLNARCCPTCPKCGTEKINCRNGCTWETNGK